MKFSVKGTGLLKLRRMIALGLFFFLPSLCASAQSNKLETDKGIAAAIAPYNAHVRQAILEASQYPQVLTKLQRNQAQTVASFQKMISRFRKKKQEWFYTITRYPEVLHQLVNQPRGQDERTIYKLLPNQDSDLKEAAWKLYKGEKKNLTRLDNLRVSKQQEFENGLKHLNTQARNAFLKLETMPDVLTLLTNNIDLTTRLGNRYKENPAQVTGQLTVLHDQLEVRNEREEAAFKKQMESDPEAMKELRQASNVYSGNSYYNNNPYYYPYSYWFGYPYWYPYPFWYPGLFWYSPGFYFGVGGLYGFPSYGFSFWFFNGGYYARFPHLYRQFENYYRSNITTTRVTGTVNRGFMGVATAHYTGGAGMRTSLPVAKGGQISQGRQGRVYNNNRSNATMYHAQSWNGFGGRGSAVGGGFHGGHIGRH